MSIFLMREIAPPSDSGRVYIVGDLPDASWQVGVGFDVELETLPLSAPVGRRGVPSHDIFTKKRIAEAGARVRDTGAFLLDGSAVEKKSLTGEFTQFDGLDGAYEVSAGQGWKEVQTLRLTQDLPLPLTLIELNWRLFMGDV